MRHRGWRYVAVALGLLLLVGALVSVKLAQILRLVSYGKKMEAAGPMPEAVGTAMATVEGWEKTLRAVGTVASTESVEVRNEVEGVVRRIAFSSGQQVKAGELLVGLDTQVERGELAEAQARRAHALTTLRRVRVLAEEGVSPQAELDDAEAAHRLAEREIATIEARLSKKLIRAPFAGRLGIREISLGQYLQAGTKLTVLNAIGSAFVDFTLPQEELFAVQPGMKVALTLTASAPTALEGELFAVGPTVDEQTRQLMLRAQVVDPDERLRPGMFVEVSVVLPEKQRAVVVPATAVVHAAYGDSVFVVEPKPPDSPGMTHTPEGKEVHLARQQFVRVGAARGDFVQILQGLKGGAQVVSSGAFKLRNGSPVVVNDQRQPTPQRHPTPENR